MTAENQAHAVKSPYKGIQRIAVPCGQVSHGRMKGYTKVFSYVDWTQSLKILQLSKQHTVVPDL